MSHLKCEWGIKKFSLRPKFKIEKRDVNSGFKLRMRWNLGLFSREIKLSNNQIGFESWVDSMFLSSLVMNFQFSTAGMCFRENRRTSNFWNVEDTIGSPFAHSFICRTFCTELKFSFVHLLIFSIYFSWVSVSYQVKKCCNSVWN